jgi:hypothetical protein
MSDVCLFVSTEKWDPVSAAIRRATNCDWSHCGFYDRVTGLTYSAMADGKGLAFRPVGKHQKMLLLTCPRVAEMYAVAFAWHGEPYNFAGISGILFGRNWSRTGARFCDQTIFDAADVIGQPLVNPKFIPDMHLTPRDLLLSPYVEEVK